MTHESSKTVSLLINYLEKQTKKLDGLLREEANAAEDTNDQTYPQLLSGLLTEVKIILDGMPQIQLNAKKRANLNCLMGSVRNALDLFKGDPNQTSDENADNRDNGINQLGKEIESLQSSTSQQPSSSITGHLLIQHGNFFPPPPGLAVSPAAPEGQRKNPLHHNRTTPQCSACTLS